ncbi:carbohydrate kinase family protein [Flavobacterium sp. N1719]|uniref:carbohydrate kinase family protein n=1 Tax=Flavobacterium sp. N1719 TaxID=2885633 RepID=UPI002221A5A8|nr:carbohydrate kinase [Flavobacterium sp. N1719]
MKKVVCFGEILWDVLPTGAIAGGAPMNVAIRLQSLGVSSQIISRKGNDSLGEELIAILAKKGVSTALIQTDPDLKTGEVLVHLDEKGHASYEIVYPVAWDKIAVEDVAIEAVCQSDAFVFGSLATRDETSKASLLTYLKHAKYKVFDVNIRPPYYDIDALAALMIHADLLKLNDDELFEVCPALGSGHHTLEGHIQFLSNYTGVENICVTLGAKGAVFYTQEKFYYSPGFAVEVVDTIGAGDSFLAGLLSVFLNENNPQKAVTFGCAVGALVAGKQGANPELSQREIEIFITNQK